MDIVWVVEQGEYSDYRVVGVYTSRKKAEAVCKALGGSGYSKPSIAEWPLDPGCELALKGYKSWYISMDFDGNMEFAPSGAFVVYPNEYVKHDKRHKMFWTQVLAKDAETAIKVANERRIQLLAQLDGSV